MFGCCEVQVYIPHSAPQDEEKPSILESDLRDEDGVQDPKGALLIWNGPDTILVESHSRPK